MNPTTLLQEAWVSIGASRLRTFLAMLGIIIGVGSVVLMLAIGAGSSRTVENAIAALGSNLLVITPGASVNGALMSNGISHLSMQDADDIAQLPSVLADAPSTYPRLFQVVAGHSNWNTQVTGTTPAFFRVRDWGFAEGGGFTEDDMRHIRRVAVIGESIVARLFPGQDALGRPININGVPFTVIGILSPKGQGFDGRDQDDAIYIPVTTARVSLWGQNFISGIVQVIYAQAASADAMDQASADIESLLRQRHRLRDTSADDFSIHNLTSIMQVATDTTKALSLLLGAIASISLIVGGIGIMNIMLVTVTERTREIGIRKAIGAAERDILWQFLLEAVMIAAVGSLSGLFIGFGGAAAARHWFSVPVEFTLWPVLMSVGVAAGVGVASGLYPAWKAAKLPPVEALRVAGM